MGTPDQTDFHEARVYSVIGGPVNLEVIERALAGVYPDAQSRTYYSQAGSRELHFESKQFAVEAYNLEAEPDADFSFNGVVRGDQHALIDSMRELIRTIEATGHSVAFEIYGSGDEILFEQRGETDKR